MALYASGRDPPNHFGFEQQPRANRKPDREPAGGNVRKRPGNASDGSVAKHELVRRWTARMSTSEALMFLEWSWTQGLIEAESQIECESFQAIDRTRCSPGPLP